jgi:hypothetical protein
MDFLTLNLCFLYRLMVAAGPLLEFAHARSDGQLRDYYAKHLEEEKGHDIWLLEDLNRMGVHTVPLYYDAAMIAGSQYYLIAHQHPALLLGYIHVMEKNAPTVEEIEGLQSLHNVNLGCAMHHAKNDPAHTQAIAKQIALCDGPTRFLIGWNELNTLTTYQSALSNLYARVPEIEAAHA